MIARRSLLTAALAFSAGLAAGGLLGAAKAAPGARPFDRAAFEAAQAEGRPILVEVTAPWCSVCRAQKPVLAALAARPEYARLLVLQVDYDSDKEALRALRVQRQSTLVAFKGRVETARSTGETSPTALEAVVRSAF